MRSGYYTTAVSLAVGAVATILGMGKSTLGLSNIKYSCYCFKMKIWKCSHNICPMRHDNNVST
jgi:hypothetical protein